MTETTLDLQRFGITCTRTEFVSERDMLGRMIKTLITELACERQQPYVYSSPSTWWDHFKLRHFPAWLSNRFPAKMTKHSIDIKTIYPFLKTKIPVDMMGRSVTVLIADKPCVSFMPDTDGLSPFEFRKQAMERSMKEARGDFRECPFCHRSYTQ